MQVHYNVSFKTIQKHRNIMVEKPKRLHHKWHQKIYDLEILSEL